MIVGWIRDHTVGPAVVCVMVAAAFRQRGDLALGNPLGSDYTTMSAAILLTVASTACCAVALRSAVATSLQVDTAPSRRVAWLLTLLALHAVVIWLVSDLGVTGLRLACVVGLTAGLACLVTVACGEAAGLTYVFALFGACMLSPSSVAKPWWNPVLYEPTPPSRVALSAVVTVAAALLYRSNVAGRRRL